jgi:hypothetical protein
MKNQNQKETAAMKKALITLLAIVGLSAPAFAQGWGYAGSHFRSNGRFVSGRHRTRPDGDFCNNWSTFGNCNPFTGERGCRSYPSFPSDGSRFRW